MYPCLHIRNYSVSNVTFIVKVMVSPLTERTFDLTQEENVHVSLNLKS